MASERESVLTEFRTGARLIDGSRGYIISLALANKVCAALEAQASRIAELEAGHEQAWRDGFQSARDCLSGDDAFCLTEDVETDAWLDSKTRARALLGDREG